MSKRVGVPWCLLLALVFAVPAWAQMQKSSFLERRIQRDFAKVDENDDGRIDWKEWKRRGNFRLLDVNGDGVLDISEYRMLYQFESRGQLDARKTAVPPLGQDPSLAKDRVAVTELSPGDVCRVSRSGCKHGEPDEPFESAIAAGLMETGLGPEFPPGAFCLGIDDYFAQAYGSKRKQASALHGGFDIPADPDAPILAAADGTVVAVYPADNSARGIELMIRHSPQDSGLPMWVYTQYAHLARMPTLQVGDRVRMGQVVGLTGNTGQDPFSSGQSDRRRPAIHFAAWYSDSEKYADTGRAIVPLNGRWMDPHAMYRGAPFESQQLAQLPDQSKGVQVPVMLANGSTLPPDTRLIWPYACKMR